MENASGVHVWHNKGAGVYGVSILGAVDAGGVYPQIRVYDGTPNNVCKVSINGEFGDIKVIKVDVDEAPEIAGAFNIQSIPTLLLFQDGKIIDSRLGFMPKPMLLKFLGK